MVIPIRQCDYFLICLCVGHVDHVWIRFRLAVTYLAGVIYIANDEGSTNALWILPAMMAVNPVRSFFIGKEGVSERCSGCNAASLG